LVILNSCGWLLVVSDSIYASSGISNTSFNKYWVDQRLQDTILFWDVSDKGSSNT
jgi:hypothetical protein